MELLTKLGIDWRLLIAQFINFAILLSILTYFVYRPVLRLLDDRRERIRTSMEDAKNIEKQRRELDEFKIEQMRKVDEEVGKFLETAKHQAEVVKRDILARAENDAAQIIAKAQKQVADERLRMLSEAQSVLSVIIVRMTEKILERDFSKEDQNRILSHVEKEFPSLLR
jgi:F-type H+-transporting ATPase subunit b